MTATDPIFDNTDRLNKIARRFNAYLHFRHTSIARPNRLTEIIATQFPFWFNDFDYPPILTVELTNACNLSCTYCDSPLGLRKRGFMKDEVASRLLSQLEHQPARRVRLVGTGESTLHKKFTEISKGIIKNSCYVTLVTNGHWEHENMARTLAELDFGMIEFSVDAGDENDFYKSRKGDLNRLIQNMKLLRFYLKENNSKTLVNVRVMIRPSNESKTNQYIKEYRKLAHTAFPQYVTVSRNFKYKEDVYFYTQKMDNSIPRCVLPSKDLEIRYTGDVLLCGPSARQIGEPGMIAGNIMHSTIKEIWNGEVFSNYREWHRKNQNQNLNMCKGCNGF